MGWPLATGRRAQEGQTLVLVALFLTALMAFAALAIDVGRWYSERRFLQNAADSAALAAANSLIQGKTITEAEAAARAILTANFAADPTGGTPSQPPALPVYEDGQAGVPTGLREGILVTAGEVRVAISNDVDYTFGRVLGLVTQDIGARARVGFAGGLMPIAVRRYVNAPGPGAGASVPCPDDESRFMDFFATANTACLGTETDASPRTAPWSGANFDASNPASDPTSHGPVVTILGQGAQPTGSSDFRGFIVLDIRNFASTSSQLYYNTITAGTNANTLKDFEAGWIDKGGYPGPPFPAAMSPPDPNDQVAILSGNSTGAGVDAVARRMVPGDEILVAVYPGYVMAIPDFTIAPPGVVSLPATGTTALAGSFKVSRNQAFSGSVTLATEADTLDPVNPMVLVPPAMVGLDPITYNPNPVSPSLGQGASVEMRNVTTESAQPGIYALWIRGQAGSPYLTTKYEPFAVKIGTVTRDFTINADAGAKDAPSIGSSVSFNLQLGNSPNKNTNFGGAVSLSVDEPLPAGAGSVGFSSPSVAPSRNGTSTTLTINTGVMSPGAYRFVVRATGLNGDSPARPVTKLLPLSVNVAPSGASRSDEYVDIVGFAVMRMLRSDRTAWTRMRSRRSFPTQRMNASSAARPRA